MVVGAGGFVDTPNQRLAIRHLSPIETPDDLARSIVTFRDGWPLRLGDVARVVEGHPAPIGDAVINDGPGLLLIVEKTALGQHARRHAECRGGARGTPARSAGRGTSIRRSSALRRSSNARWTTCPTR